MYRLVPYLLLFVSTALLQLFLFDNLSISVYLNPLIYIAFVLLLPLDAPHVALLGAGLATGLVMDCAMGAAGLNTIATLPVAFLRPWIVGLAYNRDDAREGGIPSPERLGPWRFVNYLLLGVLLHHLIFFSLETLSLSHAWRLVLRIAASGVVSTAFVWLIARIFTAKFPVRV
ncbi:MAG: rod shape-determining protein MreD [Alistipes sp.]|nr:rod shape-determining protein MreD [Alistipes sp.]MDE6624242.1 rod shape-determining protein MreD [Alistipes sp.]